MSFRFSVEQLGLDIEADVDRKKPRCDEMER
jgi:hypothetical protein